jgi:hypothetical protein
MGRNEDTRPAAVLERPYVRVAPHGFTNMPGRAQIGFVAFLDRPSRAYYLPKDCRVIQPLEIVSPVAVSKGVGNRR